MGYFFLYPDGQTGFTSVTLTVDVPFMQVIDAGFDTGVLLAEVVGSGEVATPRFRKVMGLQVDVSPAPAFNVTDKQTSVPDQSNGLLTELKIFTVTVPEFAPLFP